MCVNRQTNKQNKNKTKARLRHAGSHTYLCPCSGLSQVLAMQSKGDFVDILVFPGNTCATDECVQRTAAAVARESPRPKFTPDGSRTKLKCGKLGSGRLLDYDFVSPKTQTGGIFPKTERETQTNTKTLFPELRSACRLTGVGPRSVSCQDPWGTGYIRRCGETNQD